MSTPSSLQAALRSPSEFHVSRSTLNIVTGNQINNYRERLPGEPVQPLSEPKSQRHGLFYPILIVTFLVFIGALVGGTIGDRISAQYKSGAQNNLTAPAATEGQGPSSLANSKTSSSAPGPTVKDKVMRRNKATACLADERPNAPLTLALLSLMQTSFDLRTTIMQLHNRSLISIQLQTLCIHDLIQLVVLEKAKEDCHDGEWFRYAVGIVCSAFGQILDHRLPHCGPQCELLVPHIQSLRSCRRYYDAGNIMLEKATRELGRYFESCGLHREATSVYGELLSDMQRVHGSDNESIIGVMYELAWSYMGCGQFDEAGRSLEQVMQARQQLLGPNHMDTLLAMFRLAMVRIEQKRCGEAEALLKHALLHQERQLGKDDYVTLRSLSGLGLIYHHQGRSKAGEGMLRQALEGFQSIIGPEHPDTLVVMHSLAIVLHSRGHNDEAQILFERVVHPQHRLLGSEHPQTLAAMRSLALVHNSKRCYNDAEELLKKAYLGFQQVGSEHPYTLRAKNDLAATVTCRTMAQYEYAETGSQNRTTQERSLEPSPYHAVSVAPFSSPTMGCIDRFSNGSRCQNG